VKEEVVMSKIVTKYALRYLKARSAWLREAGDYFHLVFRFKLLVPFNIVLRRATVEYGGRKGWMVSGYNLALMKANVPDSLLPLII